MKMKENTIKKPLGIYIFGSVLMLASLYWFFTSLIDLILFFIERGFKFSLLNFLIVFISSLMLIYSFLAFFVGVGVLRFKKWARKIIILLAVLNVFMISGPFIYDVIYNSWNFNQVIIVLSVVIYSLIIIFYFSNKKIKKYFS